MLTTSLWQILRDVLTFRDAPEYEARLKATHFSPPSISIKELHAAVPRHLFEKSSAKSLVYVSRHLLISYAFYCGALRIDSAVLQICGGANLNEGYCGEVGTTCARALLWCVYWFWQSVAFTGIWTLGRCILFLSHFRIRITW